MSPMDKTQRPTLQHISHSFNNADHQASALRLIFTLFPDWEHEEGEVQFTRFTDGITNTLLKASKRRPGWSDSQIDADSLLIRAYGRGTEVLIDREKETASHLLLASHRLAPPLLARFQNGMIYRFIPGRVCTPADLREEAVWRGVASRLGQWHASLPINPSVPVKEIENGHCDVSPSLSVVKPAPLPEELQAVTSKKVTPNVWTIMQKWIYALPASTEAEEKRQALLQKELDRTISEFANLPGLGKDGLVFSHCDLLSGNVVVVTSPAKHPVNGKQTEDVSFIDYEYAVPAPAAFDLANHFAEWGGFDCDYSVLPTRATRRAFLSQYLASYKKHVGNGTDVTSADVDSLFDTVDRFRGIPGLYWGIWALIQATISQIDFDYAEYAEIRLGEYFAWREEVDGTRSKEGKEMPLRERRWAQ